MPLTSMPGLACEQRDHRCPSKQPAQPDTHPNASQATTFTPLYDNLKSLHRLAADLAAPYHVLLTRSPSVMSPPDLTQSCLLTRRNHFFSIQVQANSIHTRHGRGTGTGGTKLIKTFPNPAHAVAAATDILSHKLTHGYQYAAPQPATPNQQSLPSSSNLIHAPQSATLPRRSGRRRAAPAAYVPASPSRKKPKLHSASTRTTHLSVSTSSPPSRSKPSRTAPKKSRRGLKGAPPVDTQSPLGVVDPASGIENGTIVSHIDLNGCRQSLDVMLVHVDIQNNHDKYIVLQIIFDVDNNNHVFYERFGSTGTAGQSLSLQFPAHSFEDALIAFSKKFQQKVGLQWEHRENPPISGKYRFVKQDLLAKYQAALTHHPTWQYWVDDSVDGKITNWYDYDQTGNALAEQLYMEYMGNPWLSQRVVQSGTYSYLVDLESMTQKNVVHPNHTVRHIQRVVPTAAMPDHLDSVEDDPGDMVVNPTIMTMKVKKQNVPVNLDKPSHKVTKVPPAIVPGTKKTAHLATKSEPVAQAAHDSSLIPVDAMCPNADFYHVVDDWDATMNQANIMGTNNNNKYYKIQLLQKKQTGDFYVWTRWGRVGESRAAQSRLEGAFRNISEAEKTFAKKFREKTGNAWEQHDTFVAKPGKYVQLKIDHAAKTEDEKEPLFMKIRTEDSTVEYLPSSLPKETEELVQLLFEKDMYTNAMKEYDIDVRRMPLGNLSTDQIQRGIAVLEEIEEALNASPLPQNSELERLSSKFYTTLPHDFGRRRPPVITNTSMVQRSYDMCNVLLDMEKASALISESEKKVAQKPSKKVVAHPTDSQYASLKADMSIVRPGTQEYEVVSAAYHHTKGPQGMKLLNIWRVEREGEAERFKTIKLPNHMLLWHGSHIGAISAILASGLRIMPHSGGRVGKGIYLASENAKSQQYTIPATHNNVGCMFLAQAALGKACEIFQDDASLRNAPPGYHSVRACGRQEPKEFRELKLDGVPVSVPAGPPVELPRASSSEFLQDEYLIYEEAQARIRYVITVMI